MKRVCWLSGVTDMGLVLECIDPGTSLYRRVGYFEESVRPLPAPHDVNSHPTPVEREVHYTATVESLTLFDGTESEAEITII